MSPSLPDAERLVEDLASAMRGRLSAGAALVGIHTGGVWVAERLHAALGVEPALGTLAVTLHRDDFRRIGLHRESRGSHIPFDVENREVVLVDREGRQLPVAPDYCGTRLALPDDEELVLKNQGRLAFTVERKSR